jgi:hypothetical protein
VEQAPTDASAVQTLARAIDLQITAEPALRGELEKLIEDAKGDATVGQFVTNVCDDAQVGKIVNIGNARDVSL